MTRDDFSRRLSWIDDGYCWAGDGAIEVFEESRDGEARVACTLSPGAVGLIFRLDDVGFPYLRQKKAVDWLVLHHLPDGSLDAHLIECKRTVNPDKWREIKGQMAGSLTRSLALAGALRAEIRRFYCYTAYRNDKLSRRGAPDPLLARQPLGASAEPAETRAIRAGQLDWEADELRLEGLDTPIPHRRVQLDPTSGYGQVELASD